MSHLNFTRDFVYSLYQPWNTKNINPENVQITPSDCSVTNAGPAVTRICISSPRRKANLTLVAALEIAPVPSAVALPTAPAGALSLTPNTLPAAETSVALSQQMRYYKARDELYHRRIERAPSSPRLHGGARRAASYSSKTTGLYHCST